MQGMGLFCGALVFYAAIVAAHRVDVARWWNPSTNLSWTDERIVHIPGEFERRSPLFKLSWEAFKVCSRMLRCDPKPILAMRDQALWYDWPTVFDYLKISRDWGEAPMSDFAHNEFLAARGEKGTDVLRSNCLPKITFENMNGESFYHFEGFVCEKAPAS
jgi:hypothetical protein